MTQQPTPDDRTEAPPDGADTTTERAVPPQTRTPLFEANSADRYQRQAIIERIREQSGRRLICYVSGIECGIDRDDTMPFADLLYNVPAGEDMDLLLHTPGGNVDAAEKLIQMVRRRVGEATLRIIVPDFAKSAGTLMVLGADSVVMSDTSELGPIDPQMFTVDSNGHGRWQPVQNYLDAYDEHTKTLTEEPGNVAAQIMLGKLNPGTVKRYQAAKDRARQSAEHQLRNGMFRNSDGNWSMTADVLLNTRRWPSHSQVVSWKDAQHPDIGLTVEYLEPQSPLWREYWRLYCLQRLAVSDNQKLYESDYVSLIIDGPTG